MCDHDWHLIADNGKTKRHKCFKCQETKEDQHTAAEKTFIEKLKEAFK